MDLTIVDYKRLTIMDHFPKFLEVMDLIMVNYFAMDLTEIQLFVRPRNDNLTQKKDNEKQEEIRPTIKKLELMTQILTPSHRIHNMKQNRRRMNHN